MATYDIVIRNGQVADGTGKKAAQDWIDRVNPRFSFEVAERYRFASAISDAEVEAARESRQAIMKRMTALSTGVHSRRCLTHQ